MARKRRSPPRCGECRQPIAWFRLRGTWRPFNPARFSPTRPAPGSATAAAAYPVEGKTAWLMAALVEELMGRRECTRAEAEEEALDMPWHAVHVCPPPGPDDDGEGGG